MGLAQEMAKVTKKAKAKNAKLAKEKAKVDAANAEVANRQREEDMKKQVTETLDFIRKQVKEAAAKGESWIETSFGADGELARERRRRVAKKLKDEDGFEVLDFSDKDEVLSEYSFNVVRVDYILMLRVSW